jgi:tripartite-type tricarboxylate transporter receptor subunit TctC
VPKSLSQPQRSCRRQARTSENQTDRRTNPGKVTMASFGTGSASHLAGELFKMMAGIDMVHVPYRGGAPMVTNLIGG